MIKSSTIFLQAVTVLFGLLILFLLIRMPLTEGRAENLDLFSIYTDPLILYVYAASTLFFAALYKTFRLFGFIGNDRAFSADPVNCLRSIKRCALLLCGAVVLAGVYILLFHHHDDDPAGFIGLSVLLSFVGVTVAAFANVFEKVLSSGMVTNCNNDNQLSNRNIGC